MPMMAVLHQVVTFFVMAIAALAYLAKISGAYAERVPHDKGFERLSFCKEYLNGIV